MLLFSFHECLRLREREENICRDIEISRWRYEVEGLKNEEDGTFVKLHCL